MTSRTSSTVMNCLDWVELEDSEELEEDSEDSEDSDDCSEVSEEEDSLVDELCEDWLPLLDGFEAVVIPQLAREMMERALNAQTKGFCLSVFIDSRVPFVTSPNKIHYREDLASFTCKKSFVD